MNQYTAFKNYVDYVKPVVDTIREHHNEFYELHYSLIDIEDMFVESVADRLVGFRQGIYETSSAGYIPCIYARYGEESGATVALQLTPLQFGLLNSQNKDVTTAMFGKNPRHTFKEPVYVIMEHQYFATVSGFHTRITTNLLHTPLDNITEKLGLSYLDSERDPYLFDICFESALESNQV
tara:strand:- start:157 stop:696 length:540 start_codon:yes stop_codon:yes gene_type:complete